MSTLRGGPANKAGNIHEALWGVVGMVTVLGEQAEAIRIEEPGTNGAEFYLEKPDGHEHWQAKRQVLDQKTWSLQRLGSEGVLQFFESRVEIGESCVFASISDAPELRGLAENATEAQDWKEFDGEFLRAETWRKNFNDLKNFLGYADPSDVFGFLRRVRVEGAGESTLEALLLPVFRAMFAGKPQTVLGLLRDLYTTSVHRRLTAENILQYLESHEIKARTLQASAELRDFAEGITAAYISGQRAKLIRGKGIPREVCADIVRKIRDAKCSLDILMTSPAGGGKSAGLLEVVTSLTFEGVPVLAFRLDRVQPVASTEALGKELGLPESPAVVLSRCYPGQPVALVIDQLDFVSETSGRHPEFFDVVAALADEVRGLRATRTIHLILACRKFDFDNDSRIRRLLPVNSLPISIGLLTDLEVKTVVIEEGGDPARLSSKQFELLQLPQNLALYVESGLSNERQPAFVTQKELFDAYWERKRRAVSERCPASSGQWTKVIAKLTTEMSQGQQLSVMKARIDEFSGELLQVMTSEGVLSLTGQHYGFGHESFFDYCFARQAAAGDTDFVEFLEGDQQDLFRRGQLRQILVYLREGGNGEFARYLRQVGRALASDNIRLHLKLLVLELLAAFPDPRFEELELLMPLLESEMACRNGGVPNSNKTASLAWGAFFKSSTLFALADQHGAISRWLHSGQDSLENQMIFYLRWQGRFHADRVAEMLEPFVGRSNSWNDRLRFLMQWADLSKSRPLFDLFLRLLDDGTLDEARGPIAVNSTFWSLLYGLGGKNPGWCAEAGAHWLNRKVAIALSSGEGGEPDLEDQFGVEPLLRSARDAPFDFLRHVLPAMLRAAEAFVVGEEPGFRRDRIWAYRLPGDHIGMMEAFPRGCEMAFESLGASDARKLRPFIDLLRPYRLCVANELFQSACASAPEVYSEEALALLAQEPERLHYAKSRSMIRKCSPHCSDEIFQQLEVVLLNYKNDYERSKEGFREQGYSAYQLASALDLDRCLESTKRHLAEWSRKFGPVVDQRIRFEGGFVGSPISEEASAHMTDDQWLSAISAHSSDIGRPGRRHFLQGGAFQLAQVLRDNVKRDPERFAKLALQFPANSNPNYLRNVFYGLAEATVDSEVKVKMVRRVLASEDESLLKAALDLLGTVKDARLPDDTLEFIERLATEHPNPEADDAGENLLNQGINTVRGHGLHAINKLIASDNAYLQTFRGAIDRAVEDPSLSIRACATSVVLLVAAHDASWAMDLFNRLVAADDRILESHYVYEFVAHGLSRHIEDIRPIIERMLLSDIEKVRQAGGRLACLARLYHPDLDELAEMAMAGNAPCRLGAAEVASQNLIASECRVWCESALERLFNDEDVEVRRRSANCFCHFGQQPELPLSDYNGLIRSFLASRAFAVAPTHLLHALEESQQRVPDTVLNICETFMDQCAEEARDISTSMAAYESTVGKLLFRAYAQLELQPHRARALDLIDRMCSEGLRSAGEQLMEFER